MKIILDDLKAKYERQTMSLCYNSSTIRLVHIPTQQDRRGENREIDELCLRKVRQWWSFSYYKCSYETPTSKSLHQLKIHAHPV